jgi:hypothetical protein
VFLTAERGRTDERRRAKRVASPAVRAFYWTGGVSRPYQIRDISSGGLCIESAQEWYLGTIAHIVLETYQPEAPSPGATATLGLWARAIHTAGGGMGLEFIVMDRRDEDNLQRFLTAILGGSGMKPKSFLEKLKRSRGAG